MSGIFNKALPLKPTGRQNNTKWYLFPMSELIYGRRPVYEALMSERRLISKVFVLSSNTQDNIIGEILLLAQKKGIKVGGVQKNDLDRISGGGNHQGVIAEASSYPYVELEQMVENTPEGSRPPVIVVLDHVQDPQNLGTILRVAETAGSAGVVIPKDRSAEITPAVVRASAGASEQIKVARVVNITRTIAFLKEKGFWVAGLDCSKDAVSYENVDLTDPMVIVVGTEGTGLSRLVKENCDHLLHIPMYGRMDSMNVTTALAVIIHEARRQWRVSRKDG